MGKAPLSYDVLPDRMLGRHLHNVQDRDYILPKFVVFHVA